VSFSFTCAASFTIFAARTRFGNVLPNRLSLTGFFDDGAILCPTIDSVELVNDFILSLIPGEE